MPKDLNSALLSQSEKSLYQCITSALTSYDSPLMKAIKDSLGAQSEVLKQLANDAVGELVNSDEFAQVMKSEMKTKLARVLISQYGGEIEKAVGKLKSDPITRAKITLAIDSVMDDLTK